MRLLEDNSGSLWKCQAFKSILVVFVLRNVLFYLFILLSKTKVINHIENFKNFNQTIDLFIFGKIIPDFITCLNLKSVIIKTKNLQQKLQSKTLKWEESRCIRTYQIFIIVW